MDPLAPRLMRGLALWLAIGGVACSFDTSGLGESVSVGMSIGEGGSNPTDSNTESDPTQGTGDASADGSLTDGPAPECDGGGTCGAPAPAGWSGPFALDTAATPDPSQQCAQGWTEHARGTSELIAGPAICGCQCTPSQGSCSVAIQYYSDAACTTETASGSSSGACDAVGTNQGHSYVRATGSASGVTCTPTPMTVVPPATWGGASLLCAPPVAVACDDGPCLPPVPAGFDGRWCVMSEGEQPCPAGAYSLATVIYRGFDDTRECSPCGCEIQGTPSCNGSAKEYFDSFCVLEADGVSIDGSCHGTLVGGQSNWSVDYDGTPPTFACASITPVPGGVAKAIDPVTICCAP